MACDLGPTARPDARVRRPNPEYLCVAYVNSIVRFPHNNGDVIANVEPEMVVPSLVAAPGAHTTRTLAFFCR
jgi:hypothetical protein